MILVTRYRQLSIFHVAAGLFILMLFPLTTAAQFEEELTIEEVMRSYDSNKMIMLNNGFEIGGKKKSMEYSINTGERNSNNHQQPMS